jgi:GTPase SAR1 family protein
VNNYITFENLEHWYRDFCVQAGITKPETFPFILLGNKIDLNDRVVTGRQAKHFSEQLRKMTIPSNYRGGWSEGHRGELTSRRKDDYVEIPCFEASAKDGTNVEKVFTHLGKMVKIPKLEFEMDQDVINSDAFQANGESRRQCCWG